MKRKVRFDKRIFDEEQRYKLPSPEENPLEQLRTFSQWLLLAPFIMVVLFASGQLAIFGETAIAFADAQSNLSAEYSPWSFISVHPVLASIVEEIRRDFEIVADPRQTFSYPVEERGYAFIERETTVLVAALPESREPLPTPLSSSANSPGELESPLPGQPSPSPVSSNVPSSTPTQLQLPSETPSPTLPPDTDSTPEPTSPSDEPATALPTAATDVPPTDVPSSTPLPTATTAPTATEVVDNPIGWWDSCFGYRQPITVNTAGAAVENGYTVSYTINHQSLVSAGKSRSDGLDVRVARVSGSSWTELDRVIDDDSAWNRTNSRVLFKLQSAVAAQSADSSYYVYYGCSSDSAAPRDATNVYWYANDFNQQSDLNDWTQRNVDEVAQWGIANGRLRLQGGKQTSQVPNINDKLLLTSRPPIRDLRVEFDYVPMANDLTAVGLCSNDNSPAGFYVGISKDRWFEGNNVSARIGYWLSQSNTAYSSASYSEGAVNEVEHAWTSSKIQSSLNGANYQWNSGPGSANYFCFAANSMNEAQFDNLTIRLYVNPEPVLALGDEQSLP